MSEKEINSIIKEYLKAVKSKLPEWLKEKKEHKDILAELEEHIWSKAEELSGTSQPTIKSVEIAISHMGSPESIAKEYKRRGTPKYYITEELWPFYLRILVIVLGVIIGLSILSQVLNLIFGNADIGEFFGGIFQGIQIGGLAAFAVITIIFVALSMEGYFPEDFKSKKTLEKERQQIELAREKGIPISEMKKRPIKPYIKPVGEIIGGSIGIIAGIFFILQPIPAITSLIHPEFLLYLQFAGMFMLVEGILDLSRGLIGNRQMFAHQVIHGITIGIKLASISIVILMMNRPEIFPILVVNEPGDALINIGIAPEFYALFRGIAGLIIAIIALTTIEDFYRIYKAEKYKI
ncbi:MAG: hypothetical protein JSV62_10235 [Promethearchaeota archaeon]|nr:MAG: hypothetical protein JSV62_10235 [Candidatus Lokiarchaeota archaeon]